MEIRGGFAAADVPTRHFLLHADQATLVRCIGQDTAVIAVGVLEYLPEFWMALSWLREEAGVLDPAEVAVADVARLIVAKEAA